jgi:hypothetical protein
MQFDVPAFGYLCEKYVCICSKSKLGPVRFGVEQNLACRENAFSPNWSTRSCSAKEQFMVINHKLILGCWEIQVLAKHVQP